MIDKINNLLSEYRKTHEYSYPKLLIINLKDYYKFIYELNAHGLDLISSDSEVRTYAGAKIIRSLDIKDDEYLFV